MKEGNVDNAIIEGEKFIKEVNDQDFPFSVNYARIILAQSYLFKSTIIATKYSNEALDLIKNDKHNRYVNRRKALKATYDFINIVAGNYENLFLEDNSEKAHFFAKVGRKEEALEILKKLEMEKGRLSPFQLYYRAIATNCIKDYEKAKEEFVKNGDFHFIKLFF